jgi:hypothetical protein
MYIEMSVSIQIQKNTEFNVYIKHLPPCLLTITLIKNIPKLTVQKHLTNQIYRAN